MIFSQQPQQQQQKQQVLKTYGVPRSGMEGAYANAPMSGLSGGGSMLDAGGSKVLDGGGSKYR